MPRAGDVVHVGPAASVQFRHGCDFLLRVISWETSGSTPDGWIHLSGYQLDSDGEVVDKRTVFVQTAGLRAVHIAPSSPPTTARRPLNRGPVVPQQRNRKDVTGDLRTHLA